MLDISKSDVHKSLIETSDLGKTKNSSLKNETNTAGKRRKYHKSQTMPNNDKKNLNNATSIHFGNTSSNTVIRIPVLNFLQEDGSNDEYCKPCFTRSHFKK